MATNYEIINAIKTSGSAEFNARIPQATKDNMETVATLITEYPNAKNEFITTLTNQVAKTIFISKLYSNPFKFFKKGRLPYGKSIEMIFIDLIQGKSFGENFGASGVESLVSKQPNSNVTPQYITENYRNKYKISISDSQLKGALRDENGLSELVQRLVQAPLNSAEFDEFLMIKNILGRLTTKEVQIKGYDTITTEEEKGKTLARTIKTYVNKMRFMSDSYNVQGVKTFSKPEELVLLVTPETKALIDVEVLASAFNLSYAEMETRLVLIDEFVKADSSTGENTVVDSDTLAMLVDTDLIQFWETEDTTESFRNADTLETNLFFHRWGIMAGCNFVNAIKIKKSIA